MVAINSSEKGLQVAVDIPQSQYVGDSPPTFSIQFKTISVTSDKNTVWDKGRKADAKITSFCSPLHFPLH